MDSSISSLKKKQPHPAAYPFFSLFFLQARLEKDWKRLLAKG